MKRDDNDGVHYTIPYLEMVLIAKFFDSSLIRSSLLSINSLRILVPIFKGASKLYRFF